MAYLVGGTLVASHRCSVREIRPLDDDDFGDGGLSFGCYPAGLIAGSVLSGGGSVAAVVLSSLAGHRWAEHDLARGVRLPRKRSLGWLLGGLGMRLAGAALVICIPWGADSEQCPSVVDGSERDEVRASTRCVAGRTFGGITMAAVGVGTRWVGAGMMAYGAQHLRHERRLRLTPFVAPSRASTVLGLAGRF
ncbi:MAG: hypothetical protein K0V04_19185 [Deltaproteobacteria bacterium]|nr:hypothetical protein [Deltaproteobacteria bacterium]